MNTYDRIYALKYFLSFSPGVRTRFHFTRTFLFCLWFRYVYSYNMPLNCIEGRIRGHVKNSQLKCSICDKYRDIWASFSVELTVERVCRFRLQ
jgi:hypothetical protein